MFLLDHMPATIRHVDNYSETLGGCNARVVHYQIIFATTDCTQSIPWKLESTLRASFMEE